MRYLIVLLFPIVILLSGCGSIPKAKIEPDKNLKLNQEHLIGEVEPQERDLFPDKQPHLGIALSGGGFRSAAFSYGVLKRLFDEDTLQNVDILSTVSGGGYTGYNLVLNQINTQCSRSEYDKKGMFGAATFAPDVFPQKLFELYTKANFVTYGEILKTLFKKESFTELYERKLKSTYGNKCTSGEEKIQSLVPYIKKDKMPYVVINTTRVDNKLPFEFTPFISGYEQLNYSKVADHKLLQLIAISGAAIRPALKQSVTVNSENGLLDQALKTAGEESTVTLSDGGHSENLGALALIRRGVENIIVVDAEHDPYYRFEAYQKLRYRLKEKGCCFTKSNTGSSIDSIINDSATSKETRENLVLRGRYSSSVFQEQIRCPKLSGGKTNSKIIYLKMMNSSSVDDVVSDIDINLGKQNNYAIRNKLNENGIRKHWWSWKKQWRPEVLTKDDLKLQELFAYHLSQYPNTLANSFTAFIANIFPWAATKVQFPQYSTGDQSYYNDQFLAFVALGYFSAGDIPVTAIK